MCDNSIFDWSALPNELKRIIFAYNRINQRVIVGNELKYLRKLRTKNIYDRVIDEINRIYNTNNNWLHIIGVSDYMDTSRQSSKKIVFKKICDMILFAYTYGSYYTSGKTWQPIGNKFVKQAFDDIDNICYNCHINKRYDSIHHDIQWFNLSKYVCETTTLNLCTDCSKDIERGECSFYHRHKDIPQARTIDEVIFKLNIYI